MGGTAQGLLMAKKQGRPRKPTGEGIHVRIDSDIVHKAKYIASSKGISMSEFLSSYLRPYVEGEFKKATREILGKEGSESNS